MDVLYQKVTQTKWQSTFANNQIYTIYKRDFAHHMYIEIISGLIIEICYFEKHNKITSSAPKPDYKLMNKRCTLNIIVG